MHLNGFLTVYMYAHVLSNFHLKKNISYKIYILMASVQNAYIHAHSSFNLKKIFSHKIYI